jgi:hypothetical protein
MHAVVAHPALVFQAGRAHDDIMAEIRRQVILPRAVCPIDQCLLAYPGELCPECAYWSIQEPCGQCGAPTHPDSPCSACLLARITGRRPMVKPILAVA